MTNLIEWLDNKSIENYTITMQNTTDTEVWKKANELYKFYDEIKFKIAGLEGLHHNRKAFVTDGLLRKMRTSKKLRVVTSHYKSIQPEESSDFDRRTQNTY